MTYGHSIADRRSHHRFPGELLGVSLRLRGRLVAVQANAVDFNRHGVAVLTDAPLDKDRTVYVSLRCGELRLDHLVGVVHNCVRRGERYRSGIRFRPSSELQHDRLRVETLLGGLEEALRADRIA